ncbi:hypothetical protein KSF73_14115 [Burkholderiaceae bacterium DAT-1]|nr:hypothetical protein [Burkholderiaceae bacterium DAT-1]
MIKACRLNADAYLRMLDPQQVALAHDDHGSRLREMYISSNATSIRVMAPRLIRWMAKSFIAGVLLWAGVGIQGSNVFGRGDEACVRFISLPFNRCSLTTELIMLLDMAVWVGVAMLLSVLLKLWNSRAA